MIPNKVKVEAVIIIKNADRDCTEDEIKEWFKSIVQVALNRNFAEFQKSSKNAIESIDATIIE